MERIVKMILRHVKKNAEKTAEKASPKGMFEAVVPKALQKKK